MAKDFFTESDKQKILAAIKGAELNTSGEVRVHLEATCKGDVLDRAAYLFEKLKMHKTEKRNGVLFYLAFQDRKFAILGDAGINQKVPENFWDEIKTKAVEHFKTGRFTDGLVLGIEMTGQQLKQHFRYHSDDVNELSDDISFG